MKKMFLVAGIITAGVMSAKTAPTKNKKIVNIKTIINVQKVNKNLTLKAIKPQMWYAETSCGVYASTFQDWTPAQANAWLDALEANYC